MSIETQINSLKAFVGIWKTSGEIKANGLSPAVDISGTDSYEWLPGNYALLHKVDVLMGNESVQSIEIIGCDASTNSFPMHHFDPQGNTGSMIASINNNQWIFQGPSLRFTGGFSEEGKIFSGKWEQSTDGKTWQHWMNIKLTKVS